MRKVFSLVFVCFFCFTVIGCRNSNVIDSETIALNCMWDKYTYKYEIKDGKVIFAWAGGDDEDIASSSSSKEDLKKFNEKFKGTTNEEIKEELIAEFKRINGSCEQIKF